MSPAALLIAGAALACARLNGPVPDTLRPSRDSTDITRTGRLEQILGTVGEEITPAEAEYLETERETLLGPRLPLLTCSFRFQGVRVSPAGENVPPTILSVPFAQYMRATLQPLTWLGAGVRFSRDPGEPLGRGSLSGYVLLRPVLSTEIILGDFAAESGQGMLLWGPEGVRRGREPFVRTLRRGVKPLLASESSPSMRGVGISMSGSLGGVPCRGSLFYSSVSLRGVGDSLVRSLTSGGSSDLSPDGENRIRECAVGASLRLGSGGAFSAGCAGVVLLYDQPISPNLSSQAGSRRFLAWSADGSAKIGSVLLMTEFAYSSGGGGFVIGASAQVRPGVLLSGMFRHHDAVYLGRFASRQGFGSSEGRENGCLITWRIPLSSQFVLDGVIDHYVVGLGKRDGPPPGKGREIVISLKTVLPRRFSSQIQVRARVRDELEPLPDEAGRLQRRTIMKNQSWMRIALDMPLGNGLRVKSKFDMTGTLSPQVDGAQRGESILLDVDWDLLGICSLGLRLVAFGSDTYDARLYDFDGSIPAGLSITPLYGCGKRWSALLKLRPFHFASITLRYSALFRDEWEEGGEWRPRTSRTDLAAQIDIRF